MKSIITKKIFREDQALSYLSKYIKVKSEDDRMMKTILSEKFLPNIETDLILKYKAIYVCLMIRRLTLHKAGKLEADDKNFLWK